MKEATQGLFFASRTVTNSRWVVSPKWKATFLSPPGSSPGWGLPNPSFW